MQQNPKYHPEGDAYVHTMLVLREAAEMREAAQKPLNLMLAALVHDLGKAATTTQDQNGNSHSCEHEIAGVPLLSAMLSRIGAGKDMLAYCENMCRLHMRTHICFYMNLGEGQTNLLFDESICLHDLVLLAVATRGERAGAPKRATKKNNF